MHDSAASVRRRAGARGPDGRLLLKASPTTEPIRVDGVLDEPVWQSAAVAGGFVQSEPAEGEPATETTEVRVVYDATTLYIGAYLHDRHPELLVVNDIRKDFNEVDQDDFEVILDTFGDRRNGYVFITNPEGARADRQTANEGREIDASWDAAWTVRSRRVADGWTVEMAISFHALRFSGGMRTWGINFSRRIRRKNEVDFWSPVPRSLTLYRLSLAGDLGGLVTGGAGRDLRFKPYVAARTVRPTGGQFGQTGRFGGDLKYGITRGLTLDATGNPDFAQVEADEQQVNLTQFSQFFPEKREFFLENSGIFYVGDAARGRVGATPTPDEDLLPFFSRRIGLTADGDPVPIVGGARLTGQAGGFTVGALSIQTRGSASRPGDVYNVVRLRRNLIEGSDLGIIVMDREATGNVAGAARYNRVGGGDFNLRFFQTLDWNSYVLRTATPGLGSGQYAVRSTATYEGNLLHFKGGAMQLGENFNDDLGYVRRTNTRKWILDAGLRPRPSWAQAHGVRELHPHVTWNYYENLQGQMVGKNLHTGFTLFFNDGGYTELSANPHFERISTPFAINTGATPIPTGGYGWNEWQLIYNTDPSRPLALGFRGVSGGLWSGTQRTIQSTVTYRPSYRFRLSTSAQTTAADLQLGVGSVSRFTETLYTVRGNYSFTTNMFLDALSQYDPAKRQLNANVRFNLIHHPLSDLFVVFNEQHMWTVDAPVAGRSVIVKFTQMLAL